MGTVTPIPAEKAPPTTWSVLAHRLIDLAAQMDDVRQEIIEDRISDEVSEVTLGRSNRQADLTGRLMALEMQFEAAGRQLAAMIAEGRR